MPLTHVCIWTDKQWKHISAPEAAAKYRHQTVSANSKTFMCDCCKQNVTLTVDGYFRHSKAEADKSCPERTFGSNYNYQAFDIIKRTQPLRISIESANSLFFEIGLISPGFPLDILDKSERITIISKNGANENVYTFSAERLLSDRTTYFPIGYVPARKYKIQLTHGLRAMNDCWPDEVDGFHEFALFDGDSRKRIPQNADVQVGHKYYLLSHCPISSNFRSMRIRNVCTTPFNLGGWHVYEVQATESSEYAADFFLQFKYLLTDKPIEFIPVWPTSIRKPYWLYSSASTVFFFLSGDAEIRSFPPVTTRMSKYEGTSLVQVSCSNNQHLIAAGRANVLKYYHVAQQSENLNGTMPIISVHDSKGEVVSEGEHNKLPQGNALYITAPFDGSVKITFHNKQLQYRLSSEQTLVVTDLKFGATAQVYQSLDVVWEAKFLTLPQTGGVEQEDALLYRRLINAHGKCIPIGHALSAIYPQFIRYRKVRSWLYATKHKGWIYEDALKILQRRLAGDVGGK
jgi:hypothetical protein